MTVRLRVLALAVGLLLAAIPFSAAANDEESASDRSFNLAFECTAGCQGVYEHTMTLETFDKETGTFTASGVYNADESITWTATGSITDSGVTFTIVYTGTNSGYMVTATGTRDGTDATGTAISSTGQQFTWTASQVDNDSDSEEDQED